MHLGAFDYIYKPNTSTNSQLQKMPDITNLISSAENFHITKYTLEYRLCGKQGCIVCTKIVRGVRTPDISIKGKNIQGKLIRWMDLPVIDHINKVNLLSIGKTQAYIDTTIPSLDKLTINLPAVKEDTVTKKRLAKENNKDKGQIFDMSKV